MQAPSPNGHRPEPPPRARRTLSQGQRSRDCRCALTNWPVSRPGSPRGCGAPLGRGSDFLGGAFDEVAKKLLKDEPPPGSQT